MDFSEPRLYNAPSLHTVNMCLFLPYFYSPSTLEKTEQERADVNDFAHDKRRDELPQLWASRGMVSMDTLHARIGMERNPAEHYPVLVSIVQAHAYL